MVAIKFELTTFGGEPAVIFQDGDVVLQKEPLTCFLVHLSLFFPDCELPEKLVVCEQSDKEPGVVP